jgi:hypothetical protein
MEITEKDKQRFWSKVKKGKSCWEWKASKREKGYGFFGFNLKNWPAHRISWLIHNGRIPKGMCVLHHCDNPQCVNPKHLWLGTYKDNAWDMIKKGRRYDNSGEKCGRAKLTEKQVKLIRKIYRKGWTLTNMYRLAERFGVHKVTIHLIIHKQSWKHI